MVKTAAEMVAEAKARVEAITPEEAAGRDDVLKLPGVASTRAARAGRIWRVEENDLVYLGPRTGENVDSLRVLIHRPGTAAGPAVTARR